jgi:DNA polymerase-3 subunit beta
MKINLDGPTLDVALKAVVRAATPAASNPALSGVLLEASATTLTLTATDQTTTITAVIPAIVDEPGTVLLPAKLLASLAAKAQSTITLTKTPTTVTVEVDSVTSSLLPFDPATFPVRTPIEGTSLTVDVDLLARAFDAVAYAASSSGPVSPAFTGIFFQVEDGVLTTTATDTYRLATCATPLDAPDGVTAILPPRPLLSALKDASGSVVLTISESEVELAFTALSVRTRRIAGEYPAWKKLFGDQVTQVAIPASELTELLTRVAPTAGATRTVSLVFSEAGIAITTQGEYGSSTASIPGSFDPFVCALNLDHLLAALRSLPSEVTLIHGEPQRPVLLQAPGGRVRCLLMPLRNPQ